MLGFKFEIRLKLVLGNRFWFDFGSNKRKIEGMKMGSWLGSRKNKRKIWNGFGLMVKDKSYRDGYLGLDWVKDKE